MMQVCRTYLQCACDRHIEHKLLSQLLKSFQEQRHSNFFNNVKPMLDSHQRKRIQSINSCQNYSHILPHGASLRLCSNFYPTRLLHLFYDAPFLKQINTYLSLKVFDTNVICIFLNLHLTTPSSGIIRY